MTLETPTKVKKENKSDTYISQKLAPSLPYFLTTDSSKGKVGIFLGLVSFVLCCIKFMWFGALIYPAIFIFAGHLRLQLKSKSRILIANIIWALVICVTTCWVPVALVELPTMFTIPVCRFLLNMICVAIIYFVVFTITANHRASLITSSFLLVMLATANGFIIQFRSRELGAFDFLSIGTALGVADQYKPRISGRMLSGWLTWIANIFILFTIPTISYSRKKATRILSAVVSVVLCACLWGFSSNTLIRTWHKQGTKYNGYYLNFFISMRDSVVEKPKAYNPSKIEKYAESYSHNPDVGKGKKHPNIIVIMNESFADFRVIGDNFHTNIPVTPFIDSMKDNTVRGYALTSVFGGNTANAEFEFLTGHSLGFLPNGSVPYQQYIKGNIHALPWTLNSMGYKSIATHPFLSKGWCRTTIYPYLGFSEYTFIDDYPQKDFVRNRVSDREMYEFIMDKLKKTPKDTPLFIFGITMQNHSSYDYVGENYIPSIKLKGYKNHYPQAEQYLTLIHESDKAMEYLINELENYDEDTLVLFFGDHFPAVEEEFYRDVHSRSFDTPEEQSLQYKVPFILWANYDINESLSEFSSVNYLSSYIMEYAGLEHTPYYTFLRDIREHIPAMNSAGYYSPKSRGFITYDKAPAEEKDWLNRYSSVQYNNLFDEGNRNYTFYGQYIK